MSPEFDQMLVLGAIGAALGFFAVRFGRKFRKSNDSCAGDCCAPGKQKNRMKR